MGTMTVCAGPSGDVAGSLASEDITPQGRLYVAPSYVQTTGDAAVQLSSPDHKVALGFTPEIDVALGAISFYVTDISTTGLVSVDIHADRAALEPNGELTGSQVNVAPTMTANNAPSPYAVGLWDSAGADAAAAGYEAFRALDGTRALDNGVMSNAAPTSEAPIYFTIDLGYGNARALSRFRFYPFVDTESTVQAYPKAWTFWGSNAASPTVNTDEDWTQITGESAWTAVAAFASNYLQAYEDYAVCNAATYRYYRWKCTDRNGSAACVALGAIQLFEAQTASAPGELLQSLGTASVGSSADSWVRHTFTPYQLQRDVKYWVIFSGEASKDFSLSVRRNNTSEGSMFADGCETKQTADGSAWTQCRQDHRQAMLNVVLNSSARHCPQLTYGRSHGRHIALFDGSAWSPVVIPAQGVTCSCEDLSLSTMYHAYVYDHEGTLSLEATTVERSLQDGVEVKAGARTHRFVGVLGVQAVHGEYHGPLDTPDARLVRNRHNAIIKELSKDPNYYDYCRADHYGNSCARLNNNDDYMMRFVSLTEETILFTLVVFAATTANWGLGVVADNLAPDGKNIFNPYIGGSLGGIVTPTVNLHVSKGFHRVWPVVTNVANQSAKIYLTSISSPYRKSVCLTAAIPC